MQCFPGLGELEVGQKRLGSKSILCFSACIFGGLMGLLHGRWAQVFLHIEAMQFRLRAEHGINFVNDND